MKKTKESKPDRLRDAVKRGMSTIQMLIREGILPKDLANAEFQDEKAMAEIARILMRKISEREKKERITGLPQVRAKGALSSMEIAEAAVTILGAHLHWRQSPMEAYAELFAKLLKVDRRKLNSSRRAVEREKALKIFKTEHLNARQLAKRVGVHHSTVYRWLEEPDFKEIIGS